LIFSIFNASFAQLWYKQTMNTSTETDDLFDIDFAMFDVQTGKSVIPLPTHPVSQSHRDYLVSQVVCCRQMSRPVIRWQSLTTQEVEEATRHFDRSVVSRAKRELNRRLYA
jgi:hypothetical protein